MKTFDIGGRDLSRIFWAKLLRDYAFDLQRVVDRSMWDAIEADKRHKLMENPTGSISLATGVWLTLLTRHINPFMVFELGTYIGRSLTAIARGMDGGEIITCDYTNGLNLERIDNNDDTVIRCNPMRASTSVLQDLRDPFDLFFFDGRIQQEDLAHIKRLSHKDTIYAFDDYEGLEKGVANAFNLKSWGALIVPPNEPIPGVQDYSTLALIIPQHLITMRAQ